MFGGDRVLILEILYRSRDGDRVSISELRSCVDLRAAVDSLVFVSDS